MTDWTKTKRSHWPSARFKPTDASSASSTGAAGRLRPQPADLSAAFAARRAGPDPKDNYLVALARAADADQLSFEVRATDAAGNVDPTPARRTWLSLGLPLG